MRLDPVIAALRSDRAPQARAQTAMVASCEAWRSDPNSARLLSELEIFGRGAAIDHCPQLRGLFTGGDEAGGVARELVRHFSRSLRHTPLGHPPFRHGFDGQASTLLLARSGRAQLLLHALEPGTFEFTHASFPDALRYDAVLAGTGSAMIIRREGPLPAEFDDQAIRLHDEQIHLSAGAKLALDCTLEALLVERVERRLVTLRLRRTAADPQATIAVDRAHGTICHRSSGDLADSRREMMVSLLGRMGRTEATPLLSQMACETGSDALRWQSLRECLALDTAVGFNALCDIARRPDDPLAAQAGALRAQLIEAIPQLRDRESARCHG